jgi:hypothetical protein
MTQEYNIPKSGSPMFSEEALHTSTGSFQNELETSRLIKRVQVQGARKPGE